MVENGKLRERMTVNVVPKLALKNIPKIVSKQYRS